MLRLFRLSFLIGFAACATEKMRYTIKASSLCTSPTKTPILLFLQETDFDTKGLIIPEYQNLCNPFFIQLVSLFHLLLRFRSFFRATVLFNFSRGPLFGRSLTSFTSVLCDSVSEIRVPFRYRRRIVRMWLGNLHSCLLVYGRSDETESSRTYILDISVNWSAPHACIQRTEVSQCGSNASPNSNVILHHCSQLMEDILGFWQKWLLSRGQQFGKPV